MNKEDKNKILKLRLENNTIKEIADEFDMSETAITDNLKIVYDNSNDNIKARLDNIAYKIKTRYKEEKLKETLKHRLKFKSVTEIADIMNCDRATIDWRIKEIYKKENIEINKKLDEVRNYFKYKKKERITFYDLTDYQKGIFWGIGSYIQEDDAVTFKDRRKHFVKIMEDVSDSTVYSQITSKGKIQYVLKSCIFHIDSFVENNWTERKAKVRDIPPLNDYKDFLRAYIELHSGLDYSTRYKRKKDKKSRYKALRLCIYGNWKLINSTNKILNDNVRVGLKSPQNTSNDITKYLQYTSLSQIQSIFWWLYKKPFYKEYWKDINYKLENPKID